MDRVDHILAQWHEARPDLDVGPMGTLGRLARLTSHLRAATAQVHAAHGLNPAAFDVLATLRRAGPPHALSPSALIDWTMVTSGTMTNRLDRLEAAGWVRRLANPSDGRGFLVQLTPEGMALIDRAVADHVAAQHEALARLDPGLREGLDRALRDWLASFETPSDAKAAGEHQAEAATEDAP